MDAKAHTKPSMAMPEQQIEAETERFSAEGGGNAEEKTNEKTLIKSKLNPFAKTFMPTSTQARAVRSRACAITTPEGEPVIFEPRPLNKDKNKQKQKEKPSMKHEVGGKQNTEILKNLLNEFDDKHKQIASIRIVKASDKMTIEVTSRDNFMRNKTVTSNDVEPEQAESVTVEWNSMPPPPTPPLKAKQQNLLVAKLLRSLSDVITRNINAEAVMQKQCSDNEEEEIAGQIERINMLQKIFTTDSKANAVMVQRAVRSLCEKLGVPESELSAMLDDPVKLERGIAAYECDKMTESGSSETIRECFHNYEMHINDMSDSDAKSSNFDVVSIDAPPTTPALSSTALNRMNLNSRFMRGKRLSSTMRTPSRIEMTLAARHDAVNEKLAANRLRAGGLNHKAQIEQKRLVAVVQAAKPAAAGTTTTTTGAAATKPLNRNASIRLSSAEHVESKKKLIKVATRKDEENANCNKDATESSNANTKLAAGAYKTVASKVREKRVLPNQKLMPRGTREKEPKKTNLLWKV